MLHRRRACVVLAALSLTACGPAAPFRLAVHAVPGDVEYGAQTQQQAQPGVAAGPPAAPLPPGAPPLIYGAPSPAPPVTFAPTPAATPASLCPTAPVDAVAAIAADPSASTPPAAATYPWREHGSYQLGGAAARQFPPTLTHTVANVSAPDATTGSYTFDVGTTAGGLTGLQQVTSSYQVIPPPQGTTDVQGVNTSKAAGLYLTAMVVRDANLPSARVARFAPPILLMQFPGTDLPSWTTTGTDSASGTTIELSAAVTRRVSVDACGTVVDAWEVSASGTLVGPDQNLTLNHLTYDVATQYGGLIVAESDDVSGTETSGTTMQSIAATVSATTSTVPQARAH
ncbi:MAG TPA: hypothetical protein VN193_10790 [Candidatus Angelobacter sp.]|jgi:hypothetical protein|nr:hypothetical protein [Candidatus Angelobacter sp.]